MKGTNHVKGRQGELAIKDILRDHFTEWAIEYTGSSAHECDLHMTSADAKTKIMVESKNKDSITRGDVEKFYRDIHESYACVDGHKKPATAGVFVSIHSRNIPGKGHMCLEQVNILKSSNKAWAMFLGFSDEEEMRLLLRPYMMMFVSTVLACPLNTLSADADADADSNANANSESAALEAKIKALFTDIALDSKSLATLKGHVAALTKTAADAALSVGEIEARHLARCAEWQGWLKDHGHVSGAQQIYIVTGSSAAASASAYFCPACKSGFTNKKVHAKHVKECSAPAAAIR